MSVERSDVAKSRRILFPVDGSEHSQRAVNWYLDKFCRNTDLVYFLHIAEPHVSRSAPEADATEVVNEFDSKIRDSMREGQQLGEHYVDQVRKRGVEGKFLMRTGTKPGELILTVAGDQLIDMIMIGNRGVGPLRRTFLGSVSDYVLHHSNIPVILVPPLA
ncbi:Stress response protein nhaX [Fasciolopsis buskii]|uniref:Stress response protein nhaX n=1 Tax=Fasciolopsis buskii TaxID=27845 RepID=A0A8E0RU60_9TREM|nr:Stress response protein nhaX [Fasciolopsis buski]